MSKELLVKKVSGMLGSTQVEADKYVTAILNAIPQIIRESIETSEDGDGKLVLMGFGTFNARYKAESAGRNPKTGEEVTVPAGFRTTVTLGKKFKGIVNGIIEIADSVEVVEEEVEEVVAPAKVAKAKTATKAPTAKATAKPVAAKAPAVAKPAVAKAKPVLKTK